MKKEILIIDIETTGFINEGGKIVEIGICSLDLNTGEIIKLFDEICHETGITKEEVENSWIIQHSSLTVDDVRQSKNLEFYKPAIQKILDNYPLGATAFNNRFDFGFMADRGFRFTKKLPCPMLLSTNIVKCPNRNGRPGYKWPKVQEAWDFFFGKETGYIEEHRGYDDAAHEALIVFELYKRGVFKID